MQCHIRNWLYRAYSVGAKQRRSAWRLWRNHKLLTRKCKYLQLRQIADKHFIVVFSNRILFKAIRFTVIPGCIGKHRKAVQRNCKSGTDCLDKAFFLCPHLKKRIIFVGWTIYIFGLFRRKKSFCQIHITFSQVLYVNANIFVMYGTDRIFTGMW